MLHDSGRGDIHVDALAYAMDAEIKRYVKDDVLLLSLVMPKDDPMWIGPELQLRATLPQSVLVAATGRRLGDVVAGSGADDHVVKGHGDRGQGTRLFIETRHVATSDIALGRVATVLGPVRRAWTWIRTSWRKDYLDKTWQQQPTISSMATEFALLCVALLGAFVTFVTPFVKFGASGWWMSACITPVWIHLISGVACSIGLNIRRFVTCGP